MIRRHQTLPAQYMKKAEKKAEKEKKEKEEKMVWCLKAGIFHAGGWMLEAGGWRLKFPVCNPESVVSKIEDEMREEISMAYSEALRSSLMWNHIWIVKFWYSGLALYVGKVRSTDCYYKLVTDWTPQDAATSYSLASDRLFVAYLLLWLIL